MNEIIIHSFTVNILPEMTMFIDKEDVLTDRVKAWIEGEIANMYWLDNYEKQAIRGAMSRVAFLAKEATGICENNMIVCKTDKF